MAYLTLDSISSPTKLNSAATNNPLTNYPYTFVVTCTTSSGANASYTIIITIDPDYCKFANLLDPAF